MMAIPYLEYDSGWLVEIERIKACSLFLPRQLPL